jgi:hypothetical protein
MSRSQSADLSTVAFDAPVRPEQSEDTRRPFRSWLTQQVANDDDVGALALFIRDDRCLGHRRSPHSILAHLRSAHAPCHGAELALAAAVEQWAGRPSSHAVDWSLTSRTVARADQCWTLDRGYTAECDATQARDRAVAAGAIETCIVSRRLSFATTGWGVWSLRSDVTNEREQER